MHELDLSRIETSREIYSLSMLQFSEKYEYNPHADKCLESVASGYWTPSAKRSSGLSR